MQADSQSPYNSVRDQRATSLQSWLIRHNYPIGKFYPPMDDASSRRYFRVEINGYTKLAVDDPPPQNSIERFIDIESRLRNAGVRVPEIFQYDIAEGFMLIEDLGDSHYYAAIQSDANKDAPQSRHLLDQAFQSLLSIQTQANSDGIPAYTEERLRTEMGLFNQWYVDVHIGKSLTEHELIEFDQVMEVCVKNALQQPSVFIHLDYHSRNLMVVEGQSPAIIDFQDARTGPLTYDLVSLLKDCYVDWPEDLVSHYCEKHRLAVAASVSEEQYRKWFDLTGLQRHLKVLGIFARLYHRDGKSRYLDDLPLVRRHIERVLPRYPELAPLQKIFAGLGQ